MRLRRRAYYYYNTPSGPGERRSLRRRRWGERACKVYGTTAVGVAVGWKGDERGEGEGRAEPCYGATVSYAVPRRWVIAAGRAVYVGGGHIKGPAHGRCD